MADGQAPKMVATIGITDFARTPRNGVVVKAVDRFATLPKGGVLVGDELLSLGGIPTSELNTDTAWLDLFNKKIGIGNMLKVKLVRGGKEMELTMKVIGRRPLNLQLDEVDEVLERKIAP